MPTRMPEVCPPVLPARCSCAIHTPVCPWIASALGQTIFLAVLCHPTFERIYWGWRYLFVGRYWRLPAQADVVDAVSCQAI